MLPPTFSEAGYPNTAAGYFYGLALPSSTPQFVIDITEAIVREVLEDREFLAKYFEPLGLIPASAKGEVLRKFISEQCVIMDERVGEEHGQAQVIMAMQCRPNNST
jgi:tripartite-type tricarboxylate transporter receptor subunit TctC